MRPQPKGLLCQDVGPIHLGPVVPRAPAAHVDVDEVEVEGQSRGLHGVRDGAVQQADTWKGWKRSRGDWRKRNKSNGNIFKSPILLRRCF